MFFPLIPSLAMLAFVSGLIVTFLLLEPLESERQARACFFRALFNRQGSLTNRTITTRTVGVAPSGSANSSRHASHDVSLEGIMVPLGTTS